MLFAHNETNDLSFPDCNFFRHCEFVGLLIIVNTVVLRSNVYLLTCNAEIYWYAQS